MYKAYNHTIPFVCIVFLIVCLWKDYTNGMLFVIGFVLVDTLYTPTKTVSKSEEVNGK